MTEMIFARKLKARRRALKITQKQLADWIGYSEKTVSKWESGLGLPPCTVLPDLARSLKTDINYFFGGTGEPLYYLGIDGGGTKTDFALANKEGKILKQITLKGCNPVDCGEEETCRVLSEGIYQVCGGISCSQISVFAGIAGGGSGDYPKRISSFLKGFHFLKVENGSDAMNAIALGLGEQDGIAVILGTGSIAYTKCSGKIAKTGGFGYLFGDKGSGFSIGRDMLLAVLEAEEGYGEPTSLRERVLKNCKTKTVLENIPEFYAGGKRLIASYAPMVFDACDEGDPVGWRIMEDNMQAVARMIINAGNRMFGCKEIPVVFFGSITKREDILIPLIQKYLTEEASSMIEYKLTVCQKPVYLGALLMAGMKERECVRKF